jgi:hypothetical protein
VPKAEVALKDADGVSDGAVNIASDDASASGPELKQHVSFRSKSNVVPVPAHDEARALDGGAFEAAQLVGDTVCEKEGATPEMETELADAEAAEDGAKTLRVFEPEATPLQEILSAAGAGADKAAETKAEDEVPRVEPTADATNEGSQLEPGNLETLPSVDEADKEDLAKLIASADQDAVMDAAAGDDMGAAAPEEAAQAMEEIAAEGVAGADVQIGHAVDAGAAEKADAAEETSKTA